MFYIKLRWRGAIFFNVKFKTYVVLKWGMFTFVNYDSHAMNVSYNDYRLRDEIYKICFISLSQELIG